MTKSVADDSVADDSSVSHAEQNPAAAMIEDGAFTIRTGIIVPHGNETYVQFNALEQQQ